MAVTGRLRVGVVPGVVVTGRWSGVWRERRPTTSLDVVPLRDSTGSAGAEAAVLAGEVDVAFLRLPTSDDGLHVIPLWEEHPVVVCARDHLVTAADEVTLADLDGEPLVGWGLPAAWRGVVPAPTVPADGADVAAALVAAGAGLLLLPASVARALPAAELAHRPVADLPATRVGLAWRAEATTDDVEEFVGVVRGRTARSSRGTAESSSPSGAARPAGGAARRSGGGDRSPRGSRSGRGRSAGGRGRR